MWKRSVGILLCNLAIVLLPVCAGAAIWGNPEHQELSDVFFRDLSMAIDLHGGIYGGRLANRLPGTVFDDEVVEMTGVLKTKLCPKLVCADVVVGVSALSLLEFQKKGLFYYGSFKHPDNLQFLKRKAIRTIAYDEFLSKAKPAVPYVVQDGDSMGTLFARYIIYDDANADGKIDRNEIRSMRSDAFVEYCYAAALAPIIKDDGVTLDITKTGDAEKLNSWHLGLLPVTPITQRASMTSATAQVPQMTVVDAKTQAQLLQGQILKGNEISVQVEDVESGPAYLEVRNGSYLADYNAETRPIPGPGVETGGASYTFQSESIGSLASGAVELRAYDYAGNYSDFSFGIPPLSAINLNSANALYNNFRGISATAPSTLERAHSFEFSESVAGVSAVSIDGPQGNLWSQTFDPPVFSTFTSLSDLPTGDYVVKSFNAVGAETKTPFIGNFLFSSVV